MSRAFSGPHQPWWRFRMVWLVIGGPAAVVVAGVATMVLAVRDHDRPLAAPDSAEFVMRHLNSTKLARPSPPAR